MALLAAAMPFALAPAPAANLILNGDFEDVSGFGSNPAHSTLIGTFSNGTAGVNPNLPQADHWTTHGYNFVFMDSPGGLTATGADDGTKLGAYANEAPDLTNSAPTRFSLWGPDTGASNGLTSSPTGGNFLAADGAFGNEPIQQVINDLVVGQHYKLTFWWAAAQQSGYFGNTSEGWTVCFGVCEYTRVDYDGLATFNSNPLNEIWSTHDVGNGSQGFVPWQMETVYFTAQSTSQTLSLLAHGTPIGQPPFALIDGLSLNTVPEPTTWAMTLIGFGLVGGAMRSRRRVLKTRPADAQLI